MTEKRGAQKGLETLSRANLGVYMGQKVVVLVCLS